MLSPWRYNSKGCLKDPPAQQHPRILFGPGAYLTREFAKEYNIKHVINCAQEEYSPTWFKTEFSENYVCLNAIDSENVEILKWYPDFSKFMKIFLSKSGSIYVHCQAGINRSGFLYLAYLCLEQNFNIQNLEKAIIKQRPCALTNKAFRRQVYQKVAEKLLDDNYNGKSR